MAIYQTVHYPHSLKQESVSELYGHIAESHKARHPKRNSVQIQRDTVDLK